MNESHWLCLDCGKNTSLHSADYYMLRNKLWRQLVPREQRHGMLELTRFRRHPNVSFGGVFDGDQECPVYAGV
jgi:hypothetical protein